MPNSITSKDLQLPPKEGLSFWNYGSNFQWFILICLIYVGSSYIIQEFILSDTLYYNSFGEQMAYERIEEILTFQAKWKWMGYLFFPIFIGIKLTIVSLSLLGGSIWGDYRLGFKQIWSVTLRAELIFGLAALLTPMYIYFFVELNVLEDLQSFHAFSLLAFFPAIVDVNAWYVHPIKVINLFEILYWLGLILGMKYLTGKNVREMFCLVANSYGLGLLLWVLIMVFLKLNMGL